MGIQRRIFLKMLAGTAAATASFKAFALSGTNLKIVDDPYAYPPEYRGWEDFYRDIWTWDSMARSSHGVNCTGSCSWNVYVKDGLIMREEQAADYPDIDPALPSVNPRGCNKGACYTAEYVNGDRRIKYPLKRTGARGSGQWQQISWDQALNEIANQVVATIQAKRPGCPHFLHADSGHEPGLLLRRCAPGAPARRCGVQFLRLVLRPAPRFAHHAGRADRRG